MNWLISFVLIHLFFFSIAPNSVHIMIVSYFLCSWWDLSLSVCEYGTTNIKGKTLLKMASENGNVDVVKLLLEKKASTEATCRYGMSFVKLVISGVVDVCCSPR